MNRVFQCPNPEYYWNLRLLVTMDQGKVNAFNGTVTAGGRESSPEIVPGRRCNKFLQGLVDQVSGCLVQKFGDLR